MHVAVIGTGSWGTALAILLARNGHDVTLLGRNREEIEVLRSARENIHYLPGFAMPAEITVNHYDDSHRSIDLSVAALPCSAVREVLSRPSVSRLFESTPLVLASKGLEAGTANLMTEVAQDVSPVTQVGVLSGPNLAVEIVRGVPTAAVVAFENPETSDFVRQAFTCASFRVYRSADVVGVELAGALKNVLAIGAGMSDGLGFGDNTKGALLARGLREMLSLGLAMGCRPETFIGIAGVGDLFATASSVLSRNYRVGKALGQGGQLTDILQQLGQVAEGVPTSEAAMQLARRYQVEMPIFGGIESVIRGKLSPRRAVESLMQRNTAEEGVPSLGDRVS